MRRLAAMITLFTGLLAAPIVRADDAPEAKSPATATLLSFGGTALSVGLIFLGRRSPALEITGLTSSLVTPSLGEWYAHQPLTWGLGARVLAAGATIGGLATITCAPFDGPCSPSALGVGLIALGLVGYTGGTVYDIATAAGAARAYNARHRPPALALAPAILPTPSGPICGLAAGAAF